MNYRHAFHAGNFADVHKHVILLALLESLKRKPAALFYLDTHAGRGRYDLKSSDALRSSEWRNGIAKLSGAKPVNAHLQRYIAVIEVIRQQDPHRYPGSPLLAVEALRPGDRAALIEQQFDEARALEIAMRGRRGVTLKQDDGYAALKAFLPPKENRGLVLIDPPYESEREFTLAYQAIELGLSRWPTGVFALWYPIKATSESARLQAALKASGLRKLLLLELTVQPADSPVGLNGSGILIANPPWQFDTEMNAAMQELHGLLTQRGAGGVRTEWLVTE